MKKAISSDNDKTQEEWDALCNRCGQCCFEKRRMPNGSLRITTAPCRHFDIIDRSCRIYHNRFSIEKECIKLTPDRVKILSWLPDDCAYVQTFRHQKRPLRPKP